MLENKIGRIIETVLVPFAFMDNLQRAYRRAMTYEEGIKGTKDLIAARQEALKRVSIELEKQHKPAVLLERLIIPQD